VKLWIDAQLSPALAPWITRELGIEAVPKREPLVEISEAS